MFKYPLSYICFNASNIDVSGETVSGCGVITRTTLQFTGSNPAAITRSTISFVVNIPDNNPCSSSITIAAVVLFARIKCAVSYTVVLGVTNTGSMSPRIDSTSGHVILSRNCSTKFTSCVDCTLHSFSTPSNASYNARCLNPLSTIVFNASIADASTVTQNGSRVAISRTIVLCRFLLSATARNAISFAVNIPANRSSSSITNTESARFAVINCAASTTDIVSRTVNATCGFSAATVPALIFFFRPPLLSSTPKSDSPAYPILPASPIPLTMLFTVPETSVPPTIDPVCPYNTLPLLPPS
ncbi:hypothetical protein AX774_g3542 [Zancudomyces culisetae]|uniref:Uncharacterized protein n=1 Tax=Zancudomyces culisetae TaxID=1213189 RepID=A0A1R1PPV8_ZANCU|nr:hypothetical protein AX774_g3542 [Zancudomyces culisetae]|eukprot:OMH82971.1 hypothetical protein AX774_g3542 [Zancudomyces culisetae]